VHLVIESKKCTVILFSRNFAVQTLTDIWATVTTYK